MNWKTLRSIRWAIDLITVLSFLGLLLPWFLITENLSGHSLGVPLFWRVCLLVFWGRYLTRFLKFSPRVDTDRKKIIATYIFIFLSMVLLVSLVYNPGLGDGPDDFFAWFLIGLIFLLWGIWSGTDEVSAKVLHRILMGGAISFALFFYVVFRIDLWRYFEVNSVTYTLAWFLLIIVALGLYRILDYSRSSGEQTDKGNRFWSPFMGVLAIICVLLAVISSLVIPGLVNILRVPFRVIVVIGQLILNGALWILAYIATGIIYLLSRIIKPVEWEIELEQEGGFGLTEEIAEMARRTQPLPEGTLEIFSVVLALVVFAILAFIILALIRKKGEKKDEILETRESLASSDALGKWAGETWSGIKNAWRDQLGRIKKSRDFRTATEIYNAFLNALAGRGYARPKGVTPQKFQFQVKKLMPEGQEKAERILSYFSREYYAGQTISPDQIKILREDLREILNFIGSLEKKGKGN